MPAARGLKENMGTKINLHGAVLPNGWTAEDAPGCINVIIITRSEPGAEWEGGNIPVNFNRRIFGSGMFLNGGTNCYSGRGWKKRLIEDACAWLKQTMEK